MIKSIDTFYNGNYFRSRLEARWAVFFDALGVKYEYEPQGFCSETGECYLPDFFLPNTYLRNMIKGVYVEIKPDSYEKDFLDAGDWFHQPLVLFKNTPFLNYWGNASDKYNSIDVDHGFQITPNWDNCMLFWMCSNCGLTKIEFAESNYDYCPACTDGIGDSEKLLNAAEIGQRKRFEHNH